MNRTILAAQLLGGLLLAIVCTAIADPGQGGDTGTHEIASFHVPGKIEFPNITAKAGSQNLKVDLEWTPSLAPLLKAATSGADLSKRKIVLRVGEKRFQLRNLRITGIEWPEAQYNPKEISIDKVVGLKMDTEVVDYREGGSNNTTHRRTFGGAFKGEVVGIEAAVFSKVHAFEIPMSSGPSGTTHRSGSVKVEMTRAAAMAAKWMPAQRTAVGTDSQAIKARLTLLSTRRDPLLTFTFRVKSVRSLGFTSAEGRSMSFELFFDTYEAGAPQTADRPNRGGGG